MRLLESERRGASGAESSRGDSIATELEVPLLENIATDRLEQRG